MSGSAEATEACLELRVRLDLPDFTIEVEEEVPGQGVTALFGPSGSGKTSLLRAIAGFERPVRGRIALGDEVFFDRAAGIDVPAHRRPVGLLFQDLRLFPHLDVAGNLAFAERRRDPAAAGASRADVIEVLGLEALLARDVHRLSGGEQQRVALARTLLSRPELLLLDEPLAALDGDRKAEILPYLESVIRRFQIPTIYVSHDLDEVARLADRVLVLSEGQVRAEGETAEVLGRLDLPRIASPAESSVLVEGDVIEHDARLHLTRVDLDGDALTLPLVPEAEPGTRLRLRVRARDVAVATMRPEGLSIRNVLAGEIAALRAAEPGVIEATIQLRGHSIRARLTQAAVESLELEVGRSVFALVKSISLDRHR